MNDTCWCGCGGVTRGGRYCPGHDARHVNQLVRVTLLAGVVPDGVAALSDPLRAKFRAQVFQNRWAACRRERVVDRLDIVAEWERLLRLETWQGRFQDLRPQLKLRWASERPTGRSWREGSAVPGLWLVRLNLHPGIQADDLRETMVHELAHLFVGLRLRNGQSEWHGPEFVVAMRKAFAEAYGVWVDNVVTPRFGGEFATALRTRRA